MSSAAVGRQRTPGWGSFKVALDNATDSGLAVWVIVALVVAVSATRSDLFFTSRNLSNFLGQMVVLGLITIGEFFAIVGGSIDLSVGSVAKLSALLFAGLVAGDDGKVLPVLLLVIVIGIAIGAINGLLIAQLKIHPFIVTLGAFGVVKGLAFAYATNPVGNVGTYVTQLVYTTYGPLPFVFVAFAALTLITLWLLHSTIFGRHVYSVGGDQQVARMAGISVKWTTILVMVISAAFAALAGVVLSSRAGVGAPSAGDGLELSAITAVVLGGASLFGGRGRLIGAVGGAFLLALIDNSMNLSGVSSYYQNLVRGAVIVAAVAIFSRKQ